MTTRRARSTASSGLMLPVVIQGLVCLALLLVFHVSIGLDPIAPLRLAETRLSFLVHLVCNTAFVATLWHLARNRHTFLRLAIFPPLVWLLFVGLSAASSPIPAAAFEQWMFWLDAALLFYVGQVLISRRPDIFFLLFAFLGNLMAVVVLRIALANPRQVPPEYVLAISIALSLAAILVIIGRRPMNQQRSFLRFLLMVAVLLGMGALLKAFAPQTGGAPEMVALGHVIRLRPWTGSGIGAISQVLPSFAAQDYGWLLMPSNSWIVLRAEVGWLGLTLLWAGIMVAVGRLLVIFHDHEGDGSSFMAFGMAGVILLLVVGSFWHGFLSLPFGRLLLFLLLGTAGGFMMPDSPPRGLRVLLGGQDWDPGLAVPIIAFVAMGWLTIQEARPYRAARLQMQALTSDRSEDRLLEATRLYPLESSLWEARAGAARENFKSVPWREQAFQHIVDLYEQSLKLNPYRFKTYASLASVYDRARRPKQTESTLNRGLAYLPHNETLRRWLIRSMLARGDEDSALQELHRLAQDLPLMPGKRGEKSAAARASVYVWMAEIHEKRGDWDRAASFYATAVLENPMGPMADQARAAMKRLREAEMQQQLAESEVTATADGDEGLGSDSVNVAVAEE